MATYWEVAEDNAGNLYLYAKTEKFRYVHRYDYPERIREDIKELESGSNIQEWDGNEGYALWEELLSYEHGYTIIAEGRFFRGKGSTEFDFDAMGYNGREAFGCAQEYYDYVAENFMDKAPFTGTQAEIITNMAGEISKMRNTITNLKLKIQNLEEDK